MKGACIRIRLGVQNNYSDTDIQKIKEEYMSIIGTLIIGLIVGALARLLLPGKEAFPDGALGWLLTAILGIVGAFIGSFIARTIWAGENYAAGWIMSIIGAAILLLLLRLVMGSRTTV